MCIFRDFKINDFNKSELLFEVISYANFQCPVHNGNSFRVRLEVGKPEILTIRHSSVFIYGRSKCLNVETLHAKFDSVHWCARC
jgi:hypothetical protein